MADGSSGERKVKVQTEVLGLFLLSFDKKFFLNEINKIIWLLINFNRLEGNLSILYKIT